MPAGDMQHRSLGNQRLHVFFVVIGDVPPEIPIGATQCLSAIVLINDLDTLARAKVVKMGLEGGNTDILVEEFITVGTNRFFPTGKIQVLVVCHVGADQNVLRFFPLGQKPQRQPGLVGVGLAVRAAGESAPTADAAGHSVAGLRLGAVATGGALAGASGAYLTLSITPQWAEGVVAGRGWIAVALVIFGAWRPGRVALGALLFGLTLALKTRLQTFGVGFSPILLSMLPYLLTVGVLVAISIRSRNRPSPAPAALGIAYRREER